MTMYIYIERVIHTYTYDIAMATSATRFLMGGPTVHG